MTDQNPFPALQAGLRGSLTVHLLTGESTQLKVMSGLLGALLLCQIISVIVRWRSDSLWLFRTSSRGFISPAGTNNFLISCLVFGLLVQPYIYIPNIAWDTLIWIPLWLGRWMMSWATVDASISVVGPQNTPLHPVITNVFFLAVPLAVLATVVPFSILARIHEARGFAYYTTLDAKLTLATAQVNAGTFVPSPAIASLFAVLESEFAESGRWLEMVWISWAVLTGFEIVIFVAASVVYLRAILRSIAEVRSHQSSLNTGKLTWTDFQLNRFLAAIPDGADSSQYVILTVLWAYTIFGGLGTIVILFRSFSPGAPSPSGITSRMETTKRSITNFAKSRLGFGGVKSGNGGGTSTIEISRVTQQSMSYQVELGNKGIELEGLSKEMAPFHNAQAV